MRASVGPVPHLHTLRKLTRQHLLLCTHVHTDGSVPDLRKLRELTRQQLPPVTALSWACGAAPHRDGFETTRSFKWATGTELPQSNTSPSLKWYRQPTVASTAIPLARSSMMVFGQTKIEPGEFYVRIRMLSQWPTLAKEGPGD